MDALIEQFESDAEELAVVTPEDVSKFLKTVPQSFAEDENFVTEIAKIALELSWMRWPSRLSGVVGKLSSEDVLMKFQQLPSARDFAHASVGNVVPPSLTALLRSEFRLRAAYGDHPTIKFFEQQYDIHLPVQRISESRRVISDFHLGDINLELHGFSLFGRKRSFDPEDQSIHQHPEGQRVTIAPITDNRVSREHFSVQLLSPDFAAVRNASSTNPLLLANQDPIAIGQLRIVPFPLVVILHNGRLRFE